MSCVPSLDPNALLGDTDGGDTFTTGEEVPRVGSPAHARRASRRSPMTSVTQDVTVSGLLQDMMDPDTDGSCCPAGIVQPQPAPLHAKRTSMQQRLPGLEASSEEVVSVTTTLSSPIMGKLRVGSARVMRTSPPHPLGIMDADGVYVSRLKRIFPNAEADIATSPSSGLSLHPGRVGMPRSGNASMDTDALVIYTCLVRMGQRIAAEVSKCPCGLRAELELEMGIIKGSVDRMLRSLRPSGGATTTTTTVTKKKASVVAQMEDPFGNTESQDAGLPPLRGGGGTPERPDKMYARRRSVVSSWMDTSAMELRKESSMGLWALLLRHLQHSTNQYSFFVHRDLLVGKRIPLTREATMHGLVNACDTLYRYKSMSVRIVRKPGAQGDGLIGHLVECSHGMNIHDNKIVHVVASSCFGASLISSIVDPLVMAPFITCNSPRSFIQIDFNDAVIIPTAYSIASFHPIIAGFYPRNWTLTASIDGAVWETLKEHNNDTTLTKANTRGYWALQTPLVPSKRPPSAKTLSADVFLIPQRRFYRYFKLTQTDKNSFGQDEFQVTGLEIYGDMMQIIEFSKGPVNSRIELRPDGFAPPPGLPVQPGQKGASGGKK